MAISYVKQVHQSTPTSAITFNLAVTNSPSAGNLVILYGRGGNGTVISSVSDSKGNTWTIDNGTGNGTAATISIASSLLTTTLTTSDTISVTYTGSAAGSRTMAAYEFSGVDPVSKLDVVSTIATGNSSTANNVTAGPTASLARNGSLVFAAVGTNVSQSGGNLFSNTSGYTMANTTLTTNFAGGAYLISGDTTAKSITFNWGSLATYGSGIVVYKPAINSNLLLLGVG